MELECMMKPNERLSPSLLCMNTTLPDDQRSQCHTLGNMFFKVSCRVRTTTRRSEVSLYHLRRTSVVNSVSRQRVSKPSHSYRRRLPYVLARKPRRSSSAEVSIPIHFLSRFPRTAGMASCRMSSSSSSVVDVNGSTANAERAGQ